MTRPALAQVTQASPPATSPTAAPSSVSPTSGEAAPGAANLASKRAALANRLATSPFKRPLVVESAEGDNTVSGDAYALLDAPFARVTATFVDPRQWCDVLLLHLNTKSCRSSGDRLVVHIGRKVAQELKDATELKFAFRVEQNRSDYLNALLDADKGPFGTSRYRIELAAIPVSADKTFLHLHYAYNFNLASKLAIQGYLATLGSGKIGFTQTADGAVGGLRGAVERNTMRYYLAIEAYLDSLKQPAAKQLETRLRYWFDATEQYPEQLHEVDRNDYLTMKADEHRRSSTP